MEPKEGKRQGGAVRSTDQGGMMGLMAGGEASHPLDWTELETGRPEVNPYNRVRGVRGGAKGLEGTSESGAEELADSGRGGGRSRLGENSGDTGQFELGGTSRTTG